MGDSTTFRGFLNTKRGLRVDGKQVQTKVFDKVDVTAATVTIDATTHAGRLVTLSRAAGIVATLPAATGTGNIYRFLAAVAVTSNGYIIKVANASDTMIGTLNTGLAAGGAPFTESAGGTDDTITMNGTTTGGLIGSYVEIEDYALNLWRLSGETAGSGTLASSLSATV